MTSEKQKPATLLRRPPARSEREGSSTTVTRKGPNVMTMSQMLEYDEPVNWLVQQWIAPGRPTLLYGEKDAAKSLVAQDLFVAISTGRKWLGCIELQRRGKCVYLDYEPKVPVAKRIRQLTNDAEAKSPDLIESEGYTRFPVLSGQGVADWLEVVATGAALVIVDSLAAASPGVDENSSREVLDMLTRVSTATGAAFVVIHHEGHKTGRPRGYSGISQACGTEIRLVKTADKQFRMTCVSAGPSGSVPEPVQVELVEEGVHPVDSQPLRLRFQPPRPKPLGKVVQFPTGAKVRPKDAPPSDDALVVRIRELFGNDVPGLRKLRNALGVGTERARRLQALLREAP